MLGNKRRESNHFAIVVAIIFDIVGEVICGKQNYLAPLVWSLFLAGPEKSISKDVERKGETRNLLTDLIGLFESFVRVRPS